jgi:hypothetical protein
MFAAPLTIFTVNIWEEEDGLQALAEGASGATVPQFAIEGRPRASSRRRNVTLT